MNILGYETLRLLILTSAVFSFCAKMYIPEKDVVTFWKTGGKFVLFLRRFAYYNSKLRNEKCLSYGRILPKIRMKGTEYRTILEYDLNESGVFIDVYTIENIPDLKIARFAQGIMCMFMGFGLSCRRMFKGYKVFKNYQGGISFKVKTIIGAILSFASLEKWAKWTNYWYSKCKDEETKYVGIPADDFHYFGEIYKRNEFCKYLSVDFEGRKCFVPSNYDPYLKRRYGEYMTSPDKNGHQRNFYLAYDLGKYNKEV